MKNIPLSGFGKLLATHATELISNAEESRMNMDVLIKDIAAISQMVNFSKGLTPLLDPIKSRMMDILQMEFGFILLGNDDIKDDLYPIFPTETEFPSEIHRQEILRINSWMKNRNGMLVIQTSKELEKLDGMQSNWIRQLLGIDLVTNNIKFGTAFLINRQKNSGFTDEELCYTQTCINLMANSIENYYLKKALEKKFRRVLRLNRTLFIENGKLKTNLEHLDIGIVVTDATGHVDYMNHSAKKYFASLTDTSNKDLFNDPLLYDFNEIIHDSIRNRSVIREQISTVNGDLRNVSVIASPIYSSNKGLMGVVLAIDELHCSENQGNRRLLA